LQDFEFALDDAMMLQALELHASHFNFLALIYYRLEKFGLLQIFEHGLQVSKH
jgi:hypothetical protein